MDDVSGGAARGTSIVEGAQDHKYVYLLMLSQWLMCLPCVTNPAPTPNSLVNPKTCVLDLNRYLVSATEMTGASFYLYPMGFSWWAWCRFGWLPISIHGMAGMFQPGRDQSCTHCGDDRRASSLPHQIYTQSEYVNTITLIDCQAATLPHPSAQPVQFLLMQYMMPCNNHAHA